MATVELFPRPKFMGFGVMGCMVSLSVEAALVAQFGSSNNTTALEIAVAMLFIFAAFYEVFLNGPPFIYFGGNFSTHLRAKGVY